MVRVLLIQPPLPEVYAGLVPDSFYWPPISLAYLAAALLAAGHEATVLDLHPRGAQLDEGSFRNKLRCGYDIVGISSTTPSYSQALRIARLAREVLPDALIVVGGAHATFMPKEALAEEPALDAVVMGEGEATLVEIANAVSSGKPITGIRGTATRVNGHVRVYPSHVRFLT